MAKNLRTVSVLDPAVDSARMTRAEMREFAETRDPSKVQIVPGSHPVWFTIREISHALLTGWVMATDIEAQQQSRAFQCGVMLVENNEGEDGVRLPMWEPTMVNGFMDDKSFERFTTAQILEIGAVALRRSFFGPKTTTAYALPPMSVPQLAARTYRPADASPSFAAESKPAASSPSEATQAA